MCLATSTFVLTRRPGTGTSWGDPKRVNFDKRRWPPLRSIKMNLPSSEGISGIMFGES
jgi:hypothetical protein